MHDFSGFPPELDALGYPAPGDPSLAAEIVSRFEAGGVPARAEPVRALDHGAWIPLRFLFPDADVPIVPIALPRPRDPALLAEMGSLLAPLRDRRILLIGSGGAVHNLSRLEAGDARPQDWAVEFDSWINERVRERDLEALFDYRRRGPAAEAAHPTSEHLDPLFFVLGAAAPSDRLETLHSGIAHGSLSMRTFALGASPRGPDEG